MAKEELMKNEVAAASIKEACQELANRLDFVFVTTAEQPEGFQPTQFTHYLVPVLPEAVDIFGGSIVKLVCVVHMQPMRFWQVLKEKLELPDEYTMPEGQDGTFEYHAKQPDQGVDSLILVLSYCRVPDSSHAFPWQPASVSRQDVANWAAVNDIKDVHVIRSWQNDLNQVQQTLFRLLMVDLTAWAASNGVLALNRNFRMLTIDCFIWMVHNFVDESFSAYDDIRDAIKAICSPALLNVHDGRLNIIAIGSGRNAAADISPECLQRFQSLVDQADCEFPLKSLTSMRQARQSFCAEHNLSIILTCECWVSKKQKHYQELLVNLAVCFQEKVRLGSNGELVINIWPVVEKMEGAFQICLGVSSFRTEGHKNPTSTRLPTSVVDEHIELALAAAAKECSWDENEVYIQVRRSSDPPPPHVANVQLPMIAEFEFVTAQPRTSASSSAGRTVDTEPQKFLDAAKAISKLRWDPQWKRFEWEIGYEDRFEGLMWKNLDDWQAHTEEEDFIPTHRVRQIRLRDGQEVYWNRDTRESSL